MKISTFVLSFCGCCVLYVFNADWIDEVYEKFVEDYVGTDYEEIAPFVSSVTAGTEEFDFLVEELSRSRRKWFSLISSGFLVFLGVVLTIIFVYRHFRLAEKCKTLKSTIQLISNCYRSRNVELSNKEEIQNLVTEFLEKKFKNIYTNRDGDDVPVKLLWKGGTLVESSIHCNIRDDSKTHQTHQTHLTPKHVPNAKRFYKTPDSGGGDKNTDIAPSTSEVSTAQKMADIRKLLESEHCFVDKGAGTDDREAETALQKQEAFEGENPSEVPETKVFKNSDWDASIDPKIMNRIRLLESRLRLEELKNKNWINRMSRAEGILQQLNKQVERIEEARPLETMTETLKITSTVTNWPHHQRDMHFTLVNQYQPFYLPTPYMSLSEIFKKEVVLPFSGVFNKNFYQLAATPQILALPPPKNPQSSFLRKFLSR